MNKIQVLIDNGFITDNDIQEYIVSNQLDDCISPKDIDYPSDYPEGYEEMMMQMDEQYNDMVNQEYNEANEPEHE